MPANVEETTPLLDRRYTAECQAQYQQRHHQQQQQQHHHIISVPAVVKDSASCEVIYATSDCSHGLSLEELLLYANDPKWLLVRRTLFGLYGLTLLLTFLAACTLAYLHNADDDYCSSTLATTVVPSANKMNPMTNPITLFAVQNSTEGISSSLMTMLP